MSIKPIELRIFEALQAYVKWNVLKRRYESFSNKTSPESIKAKKRLEEFEKLTL